MDNLDAVMNQAAAAAANHQPPVEVNLPAEAPRSAPPAAPSVGNILQNSGIIVDEYVYPDKAGLKISKDMKGYLDDFEATINMADVVPIISFSSELNGNTTYVKSYDGQTSPGGGNFALECQRLERRPGSKNRGPYDTVEIPLVLTKDVKDPKSALTFDEGTEIGLTPSPTGVKEFAKFLKTLAKTNPALTSSGVVKVKVINKQRTNRNGNEWGVIEFELLGVVEQP